MRTSRTGRDIGVGGRCQRETLMDRVRNRKLWLGFCVVFSIGLVALTLAEEMSVALLPVLLAALWIPATSPQAVNQTPQRRLLFLTAGLGLLVLLMVGVFVAAR